MSVVYRIKKRLEDEKVNINAFSKAIGISPKGVYKWTDESIKLSTLLKISEFLDVPIEYFLNKEEKTPAKSKLSIVSEESEVYGVTNYKEKYFETLEKLNTCNERLLAFTDLKKNTTKK